MIRGLYSAAAGMDLQKAKVENVTNNLANANTPGYKKEKVLARSFPEMLLVQQDRLERQGNLPQQGVTRVVGTMGNGALVAETHTDYSQGVVQETGNPTDILLRGPGFLAVGAPVPGDPARVCYTRNGELGIDSAGYLVTSAGFRVLGQGGEINLGSYVTGELSDLTISAEGTVTAGGQVVDRLLLVEFNNPAGLRKEGEGIFSDIAGGSVPAVGTTLQQGYLELSNVNMVEEMTDLLAVMRLYEANQRLIQSHDEILAKAVNQVGSIR